MDNEVDARVREIQATYTSAEANVAWLLCDRHPRERKALTIVEPDGVATDYSYGELADRSAQVSALLVAEGVGQGDRVATVMGKSIDLVAIVLGIWRTGAVYVPLFTAFARDAIVSRLKEASATVVVADVDQIDKVPFGSWTVVVAGDSEPEGLSARLDRIDPVPSEGVPVGGDGALVHMFTSGTTGTPKGVVHPVAYIGGWQSYLEFALGAEPSGVFWSGADPGWAYGLYTAIVAPLAAGIPTILLRGGFDAAATWSVLSELKVTDFAAAPTVFRGLRAAQVEVPDNLAVRRLSSAGEPLTPEVNEWTTQALGLEVHDHYGQTELGMPIGYPHHPLLDRPVAVGAMGVSLPGWSVTVLDQNEDVEVDAGVMGRLAVVVPNSAFMTFTGYAGGVATERFRCEGKYFVTGDTASIDSDGIIRFSSRDDDVIIMAGYRIGPFDVESALLRHPSVIECAVVAAPDEVRGEVIEAYVVLGPEVEASDELSEELKRWVKTNYAAHAYPRRIHFAELLPKTPSGKIQRNELRRRRREMDVVAP